MKTVIRLATSNDCQAMYGLIEELAVFVNAKDQLNISPNQLVQDGFGEQPIFKAFVAIENETVIGTAIFYPKYSTWKGKAIYLEDLVVKESHRGRKIGSSLFESVVQYAKEFGATRMDWQVYDFNKPGLAFYKKYNAKLEEGWINGYLFPNQF